MNAEYFQYFLPILEIKDYNLMIHERNFFDQSAKNDQKTYDKFKKLRQVKEMIIQLVVYGCLCLFQK